MTAPRLQRIHPATLPATPGDSYRLAPEKLLDGDPLQTVWMDYTDPTGQFMAGLWRSEPGRWRIRYTEEEVCDLLGGVSIVTSEAGEAVTLRAGDRFVIPRGFVGTWQVVETTTKTFVIHERATIDADGLRALEQRRIRALVDRDLPALEALHAPDYQLITPAGRVFTRERYLQALASGPFYADWRAGEMSVRRGADLASVRYPAVLVFPSGRELHCWHTDHYECRDGAWQAVWSQATEIAAVEPAP